MFGSNLCFNSFYIGELLIDVVCIDNKELNWTVLKQLYGIEDKRNISFEEWKNII